MLNVLHIIVLRTHCVAGVVVIRSTMLCKDSTIALEGQWNGAREGRNHELISRCVNLSLMIYSLLEEQVYTHKYTI